MEFPHPSRPGYYGLEFSNELSSAIELAADVLIPGNEHYPSASSARVVNFIEERSSDQDRENLKRVIELLGPDLSSEEAMHALEMEHAELFIWFRDFIYHAYYASNLVLDALSKRGYAYHGAPQPLGYRTEVNQAQPRTTRGFHFSSAEVTKNHG